MRTFKAKFSNGGYLNVVFTCDFGPDSWEGTDFPPDIVRVMETCDPSAMTNIIEMEAAHAGLTAEVEDDEGPVVATEA